MNNLWINKSETDSPNLTFLGKETVTIGELRAKYKKAGSYTEKFSFAAVLAQLAYLTFTFTTSSERNNVVILTIATVWAVLFTATLILSMKENRTNREFLKSRDRYDKVKMFLHYKPEMDDQLLPKETLDYIIGKQTDMLKNENWDNLDEDARTKLYKL
jgi:hypothetical protein